ncbi:hypothetical protein B0T16DRAFT_413602 [Cercophora newfieldiana]|uniref:Uncharacterized protein n=1 Tax=Cercophora newfieldiana TaxID=92897 RepID=A0AA40CPQ1_9PEZI|nr:hypothetical protein B0T16DRAFT_413602 [Cercophora newfieldiana]
MFPHTAHQYPQGQHWVPNFHSGIPQGGAFGLPPWGNRIPSNKFHPNTAPPSGPPPDVPLVRPCDIPFLELLGRRLKSGGDFGDWRGEEAYNWFFKPMLNHAKANERYAPPPTSPPVTTYNGFLDRYVVPFANKYCAGESGPSDTSNKKDKSSGSGGRSSSSPQGSREKKGDSNKEKKKSPAKEDKSGEVKMKSFGAWDTSFPSPGKLEHKKPASNAGSWGSGNNGNKSSPTPTQSNQNEGWGANDEKAPSNSGDGWGNTNDQDKPTSQNGWGDKPTSPGTQSNKDNGWGNPSPKSNKSKGSQSGNKKGGSPTTDNWDNTGDNNSGNNAWNSGSNNGNNGGADWVNKGGDASGGDTWNSNEVSWTVYGGENTSSGGGVGISDQFWNSTDKKDSRSDSSQSKKEKRGRTPTDAPSADPDGKHHRQSKENQASPRGNHGSTSSPDKKKDKGEGNATADDERTSSPMPGSWDTKDDLSTSPRKSLTAGSTKAKRSPDKGGGFLFSLSSLSSLLGSSLMASGSGKDEAPAANNDEAPDKDWGEPPKESSDDVWGSPPPASTSKDNDW